LQFLHSQTESLVDDFHRNS